MCSGSDIFLGVLAILFPPLAVWVKSGICSADSLLNILLSVLGYIPGLLHAWYVIARSPDDTDEYYERVPQDLEGGSRASGGNERVSYVIVQASHHPYPQQQHNTTAKPLLHHKQQSGQPSTTNYGAVSTTAAAGPSSSSSHHQQHAGATSGNDSDNDEPAPPTYAEAVKGDHKIQSHD